MFSKYIHYWKFSNLHLSIVFFNIINIVFGNFYYWKVQICDKETSNDSTTSEKIEIYSISHHSLGPFQTCRHFPLRHPSWSARPRQTVPDQPGMTSQYLEETWLPLPVDHRRPKREFSLLVLHFRNNVLEELQTNSYDEGTSDIIPFKNYSECLAMPLIHVYVPYIYIFLYKLCYSGVPMVRYKYFNVEKNRLQNRLLLLCLVPK